MKKVFPYLLICLCMLLPGCSTSQRTIRTDVNLAQYRYASVLNDDSYRIPAMLMEYEMNIYDAVAKSGLQQVSDRRINELTPEQRTQLLLVKVGYQDNSWGRYVTINFNDYMSGKPVASCQGWGSSMTIDKSVKLSIDKAGEEVALTFGNDSK